MLTSRQKNIIEYLMKNQEFMTVKELSNLFQLSDRSIQYDLENIEYYAKKKGVKVTRNKRFGIKLTSKSISDNTLLNEQEINITFSPQDRIEKILLILFASSKPVSSNQLAHTLYVTRRTIVDDMKDVQVWLEDHSLELEYVKNKGFRLNGSEQKLREAYVAILIKHYSLHHISSHFINNEVFNIHVIADIVDSALDQEGYKIIQNARDELIFHVIVTAYRISNQFHICYTEEELRNLRNKEEFSIAERICMGIEEECSLVLTASDVGYITLHLLGAKQYSNLKLESSDKHLFNDTLDKFIKTVSGFMGVDLTSDTILIKGLTIHLKPVIYKMRFQLRNDNPLKNEIQNQYPNIIQTVKNSVSILEDAFQVTLNEDEIAYLALHIGSAIERNFEKTRYALKVIIVCASGVGTSQLLKGKIENYYPELKVHAIFSVYDIDDDYFKQHGIHFAISTVPIARFPIPVVKVSPFLNKDDRKRLNKHLIFEREKVIESGLTPGPALNELITPECISLDVEVANWQEAIYASTELLLVEDIVTSSYFDTIIDRFKQHGPYMVIDKGIAMPHARPSDGVIRPGFSLIRLKEPVPFGHSRYDPVSIIICIATLDAHMHLNALRQLTLLLQDGEEKEQLKKMELPDLLKLLDKYSQH